MAMAPTKQAQAWPLLIFDFDETLVDHDSSKWVAAQLGGGPLFDALMLEQGLSWHSAMNATLHTLHAQASISIANIEDALHCMPLRSATVSALKLAHALGCELRIISDANTFFINTVLERHGLASLFSHVYSNPAWEDAEGRLCYSAFHSHCLPPHSCPLCPANMCKGRVVRSILQQEHLAAANSSSCRRPIVYAGDGSGDLCPSLQLGEQDCVLPRDGYPLCKLLALHDNELKASKHPWDSLADALIEKLQMEA